MQKILGQLATEIKIRPEQVQAAVSLLDGGATVPSLPVTAKKPLAA